MEIFARNLEAIRIAKGYTHENLSIDSGVTRSYLSNLKKGDNAATIPMLSKLAKTLGVRIHHLLMPDLEVVSVAPKDADTIPPQETGVTVLHVIRDQTSKRRLRP